MDEPVLEIVDIEGDYQYHVNVDHVIAHLRPDLIDALVADLAAHPDVERAEHED